MLLSLSPFIVYAVLAGTVPLTAALVAAAGVAAILVARERIVLRRRPKILEIGTVVLFVGLALYGGATHARWSVPEVRLAVDGGLLAIALASMALRQPFTLQYARERVPEEVQRSPRFVAVNWHITLVWTLAFALMVLSDYLMATRPQVSMYAGLAVSIAALVGAIAFTGWYPAWLRRRAMQAGAAERGQAASPP